MKPAKNNLKDPSNWIPKEVFFSHCGAPSSRLANFYDKAVAITDKMKNSSQGPILLTTN